MNEIGRKKLWELYRLFYFIYYINWRNNAKHWSANMFKIITKSHFKKGKVIIGSLIMHIIGYVQNNYKIVSLKKRKVIIGSLIVHAINDQIKLNNNSH